MGRTSTGSGSTGQWAPLGLTQDPTPGNADEVYSASQYMNDIAQATSTIETALQKVLGTAQSDNFVGQTSTALAGQVSGRFIHFMQAASSSFATANTALTTYYNAMLAQQQIADDALNKAVASGKPSTDPTVQQWASQAKQAGTDLASAASTAASAITAVAHGVEPISGWALFWEILGWIAMLLMIPAIIFGGPLAILAFAVNLVLFVKAAVDFGEGKIGFGQFLLAFLGILAPTTEGLDLAELIPSLIKGMGDLAKDGVSIVKGTIGDLMDFASDFRFTNFFSVDTLLTLGKFAYTAGVWVMQGIKDLPDLIAAGALTGGKALGDFLAKTGLGVLDDFKTGAWVKLILPVKGDEVANLGLGGAFKLGVLGRGLGITPDPALVLKMVAANGIKDLNSGVKMWSVSSDTHFAADPTHSGLITPLGGHMVTSNSDLLLNLHAGPTPLPSAGLTTLHTTFTSTDSVIAPTGHGLTNVAAGGLGNVGAHGLGNLGAHIGTGSFQHLTDGLTIHVNNTVIAPAHMDLNLGAINSLSHAGSGHAMNVLDLRSPVEVSNIYHGQSVVIHLDDMSIVAHSANLTETPIAHSVDTGITHGLSTPTPGEVNVNVAAGGHLGSLGPIPEAAIGDTRGLASLTGHLPGMKSMEITGLDHLTANVNSDLAHASGTDVGSFSAMTMPAFQDRAFALLDDGGAASKLDTGALSHDGLGSSGVEPGKVDTTAFETTAFENAPRPPVDETPRPIDTAISSHVTTPDMNSIGEEPVHLSPNEAGVPGVLGLPADRIAVHWSDYKAAEHEFTDASNKADKFVPHPDANGAEGSGVNGGRFDPKGKGRMPAEQGQAQSDLEFAVTRFNLAGQTLHELGQDPAHLNALAVGDLIDSIKERPRLVGGRLPGDNPVNVDPDGTIHSVTRPLANGRRLDIDLDAAVEHGVLVDHQNNPMYGGDLTELGQGGFRLTDPATGAFHEFDPGGLLRAEGFPITDQAGAGLGRIEIDLATRQATVHDPANGATTFQYTVRMNGDHSLTAPDDTWLRFDGNGVLIRKNVIVTRPGGVNPGHVEIDLVDNRVFTDPTGTGRAEWGFAPDAHGGFRMNHPTDGTWHHFGNDGALHSQELPIAAHDDSALGHVEIDFRTNTAVTDPHGARDNWTYTPDPAGDGSFRITHPTNGTWQDFAAGGRMTGKDILVTNHDGTALGHVEFDYGVNVRATTNPGLPNRAGWGVTLDAHGGGFRLSHDTDGTWQHYDGTAQLDSKDILVTDHDGVTGLGHMQVDFTAGQAVTHEGGFDRTWTYAPAAAGGGFRLTHLADGSWRDFNAADTVVARNLNITDHNAVGLGSLEIDHVGGTATVTDPHAAATNFDYATTAGGDHQITDPADNTWTRFNLAGNQISKDIVAVKPDGTDFGHVQIHYQANTAVTDPHGIAVNWTHAPDGGGTGGFLLTKGNNDLLHFDGNGNLLEEHIDVHDAAGNLTGDHVVGDYQGAAPVFELHDGAGLHLANFNVELRAAGDWKITDTTAGITNGDYKVYGHGDGALHGEGVKLQDDTGQFIHTDHTGPAPVLSFHDAGDTAVGHYQVTVEPTGGWRVTDTRPGAHNGDWRTYDPQGTALHENIRVLDSRGRPEPKLYSIDFTTRTWHHADGATGLNLPDRYGNSGPVVRKANGDLQLSGPDKTPAYYREKLNTGNTLETVKASSGTRNWHEWNDAGVRIDSGYRHYGLEPNGVNSKDLGKYGQTIREYRVTIDGGLIRAEKMPDGTISWTRFTGDGRPAVSGTRLKGLTGWRDVITRADGTTHIVQQKWSTFNLFAHADHYMEHGVALDATTGAYVVKDSYKEISQQAKDTGGADTLANRNTLTWKRYAEQKPPDWIWKNPDNIDNWFSRGLAHWPGSKYGAVDFPHDGFLKADSRYQVFKWDEKAPPSAAHPTGETHSSGVRTVAPDGSTFDYVGDGILVRSTVKLDNGHTIEIGKDAGANPKWAAVDTRAGMPPANRTLNWREIDSGKAEVASGTRTFDGKQWIDSQTVPDPRPGAMPGSTIDVVVRHTDGDGGNVTHYIGADKPTYHATATPINRIAHSGGEFSITRDTMGDIVGRDDRFGDVSAPGLGAHPVTHISGSGDPRTGKWTWSSSDGSVGIRISKRNERWVGAWDDSFADFHTSPAGVTTQVRDFRALDKGNSIKAEEHGGVWHSDKYDVDGNPVANKAGTREWKQNDGTWGAARPPGMNSADWRDLDANGDILRDLQDGRVREYTTAGDAGVWKEYDFGQVIKERAETAPGSGLFREKEALQKQWRDTDAAGVLIRFRGLSGRVFERGPTGRWTMIGKESENKGALTSVRAANQRFREVNRREFAVQDGVAGRYVGEKYKIFSKIWADTLQDYVIDVVANIIITGAVDDWDYNGDTWGSIFVGGLIKSGFKSGYGLLHETWLKGPREGLANLDSGKGWNRNPYNHDKNIDNEWGGNENPRRWRTTVYDYAFSSIGVGAFSNFVSGAVTSAAFGVGPDHVKLTGVDALKAGGEAMAGNLIGNISVGAGKTAFNNIFSGRLFHKGGVSEFTLLFGEKLFEKFLVNDVLNPAEGLKPKPPPTTTNPPAATAQPQPAP
jgi:hypothetical protein